MANTYKATGPLAEAQFGGDVFEYEFSPGDEADWLAAGLEIVPRTYRAVSDNYEYPEGEEFEAAYPVEVEAALIGGGHIERVDKPKPKSTTKKAK